MTVIWFIVALILLFTFVTGWCVGLWRTVHYFRRKHRLEKEADDRAHRKALAEDFREATKELTEGAINFEDYALKTPQRLNKVPR